MIPLAVVPGGGTVPSPDVIFKVPEYEAEPSDAVTVVPVTVEATVELTVTLNVADKLFAGTVTLVTADVELPSVVIV